VRSSTDLDPSPLAEAVTTTGHGPARWPALGGVVADLPGSITDLRSLLSFRSSSLDRRQRRRLRIGGLVVLGLTALAIVAPAYARERLDGLHAGQLVAVLPSFYVGFVLLAIVSSIASGGGRELVPREQAVAFPVSTWTEHLGALLLAPLNIAWLLQAWTLLGATTYVLGPANLWAAALPVLVWIVVGTALGQAVGWVVEGLRRGRYGVWVMRALLAGTAVGGAVLVTTGTLTDLLDRSPTVRLLILAATGTAGSWGAWLTGMGVLVLLTVGAVMLGGLPARWALRRPQREEARLDSGSHRPRPGPTSDLMAMVRIDRAGVWRSVPLRRGLVVLALMPGLIAAAGSLRWDLITILPGLVASGGGLLFGVNAWCLDGRGALWRDSLPANQWLVFASKVVVMFELLLMSASVTIILGGLRAGVPTSAEISATVCAAIVVSSSVVSGAMRWSVKRPFAVDMRSARATPAPPVVMVGYSTRLALTTTFIGLVFSWLAYTPDWRYPVVIAVPLLMWSTARLLRTARRWQDPVVRSRVVAVVSG
jgi:hypothetical protein